LESSGHPDRDSGRSLEVEVHDAVLAYGRARRHAQGTAGKEDRRTVVERDEAVENVHVPDRGGESRSNSAGNEESIATIPVAAYATRETTIREQEKVARTKAADAGGPLQTPAFVADITVVAE